MYIQLYLETILVSLQKLHGLNLYYPNEFIKTEYTIRPKERPRMRQVSINYLVNDYSADKVKERYKNYKELNKLIESVGFIKYYDYPGNVIPIWPGASENRGKSYCFDIPDLYFGKSCDCGMSF